jgi:hypothetical protein
MGSAWHRELNSIGTLALPFAAPGTGGSHTEPGTGQVQRTAERPPHQAPGTGRDRQDRSR